MFKPRPLEPMVRVVLLVPLIVVTAESLMVNELTPMLISTVVVDWPVAPVAEKVTSFVMPGKPLIAPVPLMLLTQLELPDKVVLHLLSAIPPFQKYPGGRSETSRYRSKGPELSM